MATKIREVDPTVMKPGADLIEKANYVRMQNSDRDRVFKEIDEMYDNKHAIPYPASIPAETQSGMTVRSGMMAEVADRIDGLFTGSPQVKVFPSSISKDAAGSAEKIEDFLNAFFLQSEAEEEKPTWDLRRKDVLTYGIGGGYDLLVPKRWSNMPRPYIASPDHDEEEQKKRISKSEEELKEFKLGRRLPIMHRASRGPSLYPVYDDQGLSEVFELYWREADDLAATYPDSEFAQDFNKKRSDRAKQRLMVPCLRHANRKYCTYAVLSTGNMNEGLPANHSSYTNKEQILKQWEHKLPYEVPYTVMKGYVTTRNEPEKSTFGVLYHLREPVKYLDTLLSQRAAYIRMFAWPTPVLKRLPNMGPLAELAGSGRPEPLVWREGEMLQLLPGEDLTFLILQGGGEEIEAQIATIMRFIDRAGLSSVTYGQSSSDASSGYAISTLLQATQSKLAPLEKHLRQGHERDCRLILSYILALDTEVYIFDRSTDDGRILSLSPKDLGGKIPQMQSKIKADLKTDIPAIAQTEIILKQEGLHSQTRAMEEIGVDDPIREQKRILIDQTAFSQEARGFVINEAFRRTKEAQERKQKRQPTPEMAQNATPAITAAMQTIAGQGEPVNPELAAALPGGMMNPMNPAAGGPNLNVTTPGIQRAPNPPPPNAGAATPGIPAPQPERANRQGGRRAGGRRRPGGPNRTGNVNYG